MEDTELYESLSSDGEETMDEPVFKIKSTQDNSSINNLYNTYLKDNTIILRPTYQRNFCWTGAQQELLIDSLINGFPIPSILIAEVDDFKYECIDGQHRLYTIKQFIENKLVYKDAKTDIYYYYEDKEGSLLEFIRKKKYTYLPLPIQLKKEFERRQICICIIDKSTKLDEYHKRVLFQRLQNGTRVSMIHKIKNMDHMITNKLAALNYMNTDVYKKLTSLFNSQIKLRKKYNNTDQLDTYCFNCLLRIIHTYNNNTKICLMLGQSNMIINILRDLANKKFILTDKEFDECITKFTEFIYILHDTKSQYYEYYIILLFNIYKNYGHVKLLQVLANAKNYEQYNKQQPRNIINNASLNSDYIEIIKYISNNP